MASDDERAIRKLGKLKNWTVVSMEQHMAKDRQHKTTGQDGADVIRVIDTMARADFFIGSFTSCMGRFIYQLGRSRGNFLREGTVVSVDSGWYPDP